MSYIGIDLGGTRIKIGLVENYEVIDSRILPSRPKEGFEAHLRQIDFVVEQILNAHSISQLEGVAMAFPGLVNPVKKVVLSTNEKYGDAVKFNLQKYYQKKWNCSFFIDNDTRMATVAEWKLGSAKGCDNLVMVTLGTGIGTSVVLQGQLLRGKHFQAGCLGGHFTVNFDGKLCNCGNIGCVEAEASSWNITSLAKNHVYFKHSSLYSEDLIDFNKIFSAAREGDQIGIELRDYCLNIWSAGIITYIHAYDPEQVILGGGILKSSSDIVPFIKEKIKKHAWTPWGNVTLKVAELKDFAGVIGAVYCLKNKI